MVLNLTTGSVTGGSGTDTVAGFENVNGSAYNDNFTGVDRRLSFVVDRATVHDFGQGPIERTGNPTDVAVSGKAFFVVQINGNEFYTRNGAFTIDNAGYLENNGSYLEGWRTDADGKYELVDL